jgi:GntR family transcriptional regulator
MHVTTASFVPLYEQVKAEARRLISIGAWRPRDPLPSIRELAAELLVNPNTVARAYRELERDGLDHDSERQRVFCSRPLAGAGWPGEENRLWRSSTGRSAKRPRSA